MSPTTRSRGPHGGGGRRGGPPRPARASQGPPIEPLHPSSEPPDIRTFDHWALAPEVLDAIAEMGITTPTPIQRLAIQPALERRDVIAQAETGTGKTLAFGAPVMSKIDPSRVSVQALVLTPTRELAEQVAKVLETLGRARNISVVLIVGGEPAKPQVDALKKGAQVVVGTPGRVLDLMGQGFLSFPWTEFVVLDEADEMLEIGFLDDVEKILLATDPEIRNTLLFSATFPPELLKLARKHSQNPAEIATASGVATVDTIEQDYFVIDDDDRPMALIRMIEQSEPDDVLLIFCERRTEVERLFRRLERLPFPIKALHGGYDQESRFRVMGAFRAREVKALVATDVASRGLDVEHVTHVVNYSVPRDVTSYTHRIGRTGRAGREGHATTLVPAQQARRWQAVLREASWKIHEVQPPGPTRRGETRRPARAGEARPGASGSVDARPARGERREPEERGDTRRGELQPSSGARPPRDSAREPQRESQGEPQRESRDETRGPRRGAREERSPSEAAPPRGRGPAQAPQSALPAAGGERIPGRTRPPRDGDGDGERDLATREASSERNGRRRVRRPRSAAPGPVADLAAEPSEATPPPRTIAREPREQRTVQPREPRAAEPRAEERRDAQTRSAPRAERRPRTEADARPAERSEDRRPRREEDPPRPAAARAERGSRGREGTEIERDRPAASARRSAEPERREERGGSRSEPRPEPRSEARAVPRPEPRTEPRPEPRSEPRPERASERGRERAGERSPERRPALGGFGAGVTEPEAPRPGRPRREPNPPPSAPSPPMLAPQAPRAPGDPKGGFGAGI